jgi:dienelactone hydrolase
MRMSLKNPRRLAMLIALTAWPAVCGSAADPPRPAIELAAAAEEEVFSAWYSNNGASPMWCFGNTCLVRLGDRVFASIHEPLAGQPGPNDCRWSLFERTNDGWQRRQADPAGRTREPAPLACLPPSAEHPAGRVLLSANPTLLAPGVAGPGPARPELLVFDAASPGTPPVVLAPAWKGTPAFSEHSYRSLAVDRRHGEVFMMQYADAAHGDWSFRDRNGGWHAGRIAWPPYAAGDLAPFNASHGRVNYPVVAVRDGSVHVFGPVAHDNWSRVKTPADLQLPGPPGKPASGLAARAFGNRWRRLLYAASPAVDREPFSGWLEIASSFSDGGWLFPGDIHVDDAGTVHLLWYRGPMLASLRDARYPDIVRVHAIEYARVRNGRITLRSTLHRGGEQGDSTVPIDVADEERVYVTSGGERLVNQPVATPRFHVAPGGRLFVVSYFGPADVTAAKGAAGEQRLLEIPADGPPDLVPAAAWQRLPLAHPLPQFFTATPRAGCEPSHTLDLFGHRRGGFAATDPVERTEWKGTLSYARVRIDPIGKTAAQSTGTSEPVVPGPRMVADFMNAEANRLLDRRDAEIAAIDMADEVRERQRRMRKWFAEKLGPMPPKARRPPRITGEIDRDGYRVQKVIYETWPDQFVTAAFYLPDERADRPGPFPGVLLPCGHSDAAKAAEPYQAASILLARHGFAVLCFDPIGQGERRQFPDRDWGSYPSLPEHMEVTGAALLIGRQAASYFVGDLIRSLDYLASRPEVDASRLGCTGISGGGMQTAYLMALDDRLKAAAPGCFITGFRRQLATRGVEEAEQNIGGQLTIGLDHGDYLLMAAPTPSLVLAATRDFFDIAGTRATAAEAKRLFGVLGHVERMEIAERDVEHGFGQPLREAALAWMNRWLKDDPSAPAETPPQLLSRQQLQCTPEGNVFRAGLGKTTMDLIAEEEAVLAEKRAKLAAGRTPTELAATVRGLLRLPATVPTATVVLPPAAKEGTPFRRLVFATEPGIVVPGLLAEPLAGDAAKDPRPLMIILADRDLEEATRGRAATEALAGGMRVLAISVRGTGETAPQVKLNEQLAPLFGHDWQESLLGVLLDRPLLGQKVHDVLAVIAWARETYGHDLPLHLHGRAATGPVALHAAVLADAETDIEAVSLVDSLASWQSLVQARFHDRELATIVPAALTRYDLPDLAAALGDRLVTAPAAR